MAQKERVTMSELSFRLETELTKLSTNIDVGETLLNINDIKHKSNHRETPSSVTINKEYLSRIQSEIHEYHYKMAAISKKLKESSSNQQIKSNDIQTILIKTNNQIKKIEDMFFALNTGYIKQITPNSQKLLDDYDKRTNPKYSNRNRTITTSSKYGKVLRNGYLTKQGHVRKSWKKRLFILTTDGYLRYYDTKQRLLNEIDLATAQFVSVETEHSHYNKPFVFTVKVPNREFIFAAENENVRKSWIAAIQKAMLKKSFHCNAYGNMNKKHEILMTLTKLEWNQLQDTETLADLQEELEDIADIQLIEPNKLKIIATSDAWVLRHIINEYASERSRKNTYIDWQEMIQKVKQFFEKAHGDVIMQGWLLKKMEFRNWKKRWVVIRNDYKIDYYLTTKTDKKKECINLANMKGVREIFIGQYDLMSQYDFVFEIENTDRKVRFACANKQELKLWLKRIEENCKYVKTVRANSEDSDGDEPLYTEKRVRKDMIDPIIV